MKSIKLAIPLITLIIVYLIGSWFYPYSWISINKSYSYNQDNVSGKEFLEKYKLAKEFAKEQNTDKVSLAVMDFYNTVDDSFIVELGKQSISKQELASLERALKKNRKSFTKLLADKNVKMTEESKQCLLKVIDTIENTENWLEDIQHQLFDRKTVRRSIRNTLVTLVFASELTDDFYRSYVESK
ncbi:hypothetical protein KHA93_20250 [Bacillus sp. FJAT-49732]|uniref:Uncharacterized protein n=1 Tax=Lederbergia citrisecunda TaxID=2833583 RepID=A0A942TP57_9BACI|nr:hypothetical protein [Lederbergia citrisecunda]MBS4201941.1 hypothetical protein [Lederbergia citrisecunda]